jgi:type II secretory pathway pseudopilin PulG
MSLVEVIMVMAILGVVMLAVMSLYIPAVKSTTVQTRVTDVQSNLRLAADRMTQDLLLAGFLVADEPIVNETAADLTIRTRTVVESFGRVASAVNSASSVTLTLSNADMVDYFPANSLVRIFNPVNMTELAPYNEANATQAQDHAYTVTAVAGNTLTVNHAGALGGISNAEFVEAIVVRVRDNQQPPTQTIRYRVVDGNLERTVNNVNQQILARGVDSVTFAYGHSATSGRVNKVDFTLRGRTEAYQGDIKTRQFRSSVTLRNVF